MSPIYVALALVLGQVTVWSYAAGVVVNEAAVHLTCSGDLSVPSTLVVSDKLHPLHGALFLDAKCKGGADRFVATFPLPVQLNIYYDGNDTQRCVFDDSGSNFTIDVDVIGYGNQTIHTLTVSCPKPIAATPPFNGTVEDYPLTNQVDLQDYIWNRCGESFNILEFIPHTYKIVAALNCQNNTQAYIVDTTQAVERKLYLAGDATQTCIYKLGDPRSVDVSFFRYNTLEYIGSGTMTYCKPRTDKKILKVIPHCGQSIGDSAWVTGITDVDADFRAICKGEKTFIFDNLDNDDVNYKLPVVYSGNATTDCVFNRRENSEVYVITVLVSWGEKGAVVHKHTREYQVTCTFDATGTDFSADQKVEDTLIAPKVIQNYGGSSATSYIRLYLMDVLDRQVYELPLGRMVRLRAWSNGLGGEVGIRPVGCDAVGVNTNQRFAIVRAGCGDGIVFKKDSGFETSGLNSTSPYFKIFSMHRDAVIKFECNFTMCLSNCDGDSCTTESSLLRKRSSRDIYYNQYLLAQTGPLRTVG